MAPDEHFLGRHEPFEGKIVAIQIYFRQHLHCSTHFSSIFRLVYF